MSEARDAAHLSTQELLNALTTAHSWADKIRPRVHPDNADDGIACALVALCLEVRALTLAVLLQAKHGEHANAVHGTRSIDWHRFHLDAQAEVD